MRAYREINKIKIIFFSGTGSTAIVADTFEKSLRDHGKTVMKHELNKRNLPAKDDEDMAIFIYPVHACNAPEPVYEYINAISTVDKVQAVVISVSGGGEIIPNTASRLHCIKRLEKKGYDVIYEKMIVMPSNWMVATVDGLAIRLLEILPSKVEKIVSDLFSGVRRRTKPDFINRLLSDMGELEKYFSGYFGKKIEANENCNGCGWCEKACPRINITLNNGRPNFNNTCVLCLRCIYGCPQKALMPGIGKFIIIKQGYSLSVIGKQTGKDKLDSVEELAKGYLWKGVKEYLLNND
jgi:ferredoxin